MRKTQHLYLALLLGFLLGIRDGNIALWKDGSPEPVRIFPYRAEMLPPQQQAALEKGIPIDSPEELEKLVENYLS